MKTRNGFVSNSSSSSFTCDICSNTQSGWDMGLSECEMSECQYGHIFCNGHKTEGDPSIDEMKEELWDVNLKYAPDCVKELVKKGDDATDEEITKTFEIYDNSESEGGSGCYACMPFYCPICNLTDVTDRDLIKFLLQMLNKSREEIIVMIQESFETYDAFSKSLE